MNRTSLSRRLLMKRLGLSAACTALLPPLEAFGQAAAVPKRFIVVGTPQGTVHEKWVPTFANNQLDLSFILKPLEPMKSQLVAIDGLRYLSSIEKGADKNGHYAGMSDGLTGRGNARTNSAGSGVGAIGLGVSLDQYLAKDLSAGLAFRSLELAIATEGEAGLSGYSYTAAKQQLVPENNPQKVWDTVFKNATLGGTQVDPKIEARKKNRRAILDLIRKDLKVLTPKLGKDDQQRLGTHLASVEELDLALSAKPPASSLNSCTKPVRPPSMNYEPYNGNDNIPAISRNQINLLVMALACDLTRVGSLQYGRGGAQHRFTWLGPEFNSDPDNGPNDGTQGIHGLAHNENTPSSRDKLARCHQWYSGEVLYLLQKLASISEGAGSMLDNTVVLWLNEMGNGSHSLEKIPFVLAGNVGKYFRTNGRLVTAAQQPHNRLLLSLCQAFGKADTSFGDPDYCMAGPLAGLT